MTTRIIGAYKLNPRGGTAGGRLPKVQKDEHCYFVEAKFSRSHVEVVVVAASRKTAEREALKYLQGVRLGKVFGVTATIKLTGTHQVPDRLVH